MNKAMFDFNKPLFVPSHKSFDNDIDINILDETRTIVPVGRLWDNIPLKGKFEADISKAFTQSFIDIVEIPVLINFDSWQPFNNTDDISDLHELTLYYVRVNSARKPNDTTVKNINSDRHGFCKFMKHNDSQQFIEENMLHYNESLSNV